MTWEVKDTSKEYLSVHGINLRVNELGQVLDNFVACVTGEESAPLASLEDAVAVTRVLEAVSLDSRKREAVWSVAYPSVAASVIERPPRCPFHQSERPECPGRGRSSYARREWR